jgi:hypothetical protein
MAVDMYMIRPRNAIYGILTLTNGRAEWAGLTPAERGACDNE